MLGRLSADVCDHLVGDDETERSAGRDPAVCCHATDEGFRLNTFREDLPLSSGVGPGMVAFPVDFPKIPFDFVSGTDLVLGEGSRILGRGSPVYCGRLAGACPLLDSVCPDMCAISASLCSTLLCACCAYVPILLVLAGSPGRVGGSNPD
jgi:hypothetical protein